MNLKLSNHEPQLLIKNIERTVEYIVRLEIKCDVCDNTITDSRVIEQNAYHRVNGWRPEYDAQFDSKCLEGWERYGLRVPTENGPRDIYLTACSVKCYLKALEAIHTNILDHGYYVEPPCQE